MNLASWFWLIPLLPLVAFALLALGFSRSGRLSGVLALVAILGATLLSVSALVAAAHGTQMIMSVPWLRVGGRIFLLSLWGDPLSTVMATLVSFICLIVLSYAVKYMAQDPLRGRFFAEMSLFAGSMLSLVLAGDLITLFIAWELVGLCSYLLIGFWFERPGVPEAATKAFLLTRLADLALLAGVLLLLSQAGTGQIDQLLARASSGQFTTGLLPFITLLLFLGAAGKSAQVPFQGWLPDAMTGPTPVSALLHSATMVAAGVFLVARLYPLFVAVPSVLQILAWIGVLTALLGGAVALVEADLKRTLAYSTMSQIGLMFVGLGSGSFLAGVFLLLAQAFYKSTLFLAAGAVERAIDGTTFERMGGLLRRMPWTAAAFALSSAALAGLPVTLALPPKDLTLVAAWHVNVPLFIMALIASLFTACYSARIFGLVFLGPPSQAALSAKEAPRGLLIPVLILALLIPLIFLANAALFDQPLSHLFRIAMADTPVLATILALLIAVIGVLLGLRARFIWPGSLVWPPLRKAQSLLQQEFGFRPLYRFLVRWGLRTSSGLNRFDQRVFDTSASAAVRITLVVIQAFGRFDVRALDAALSRIGEEVLAFSQRLRRWQSGRIENYLLVMIVWGVGVLALAVVVSIVIVR